MTEHAVLIAGGGPTGMTLAAELALAGVDVAIVERRANQDLAAAFLQAEHDVAGEVQREEERVQQRKYDQRGTVLQRILLAGAGE